MVPQRELALFLLQPLRQICGTNANPSLGVKIRSLYDHLIGGTNGASMERLVDGFPGSGQLQPVLVSESPRLLYQ